MTCLETYMTAADAADAARDLAIQQCNGNLLCEKAAIQTHYAAIVAAYEAYLDCVANQEGEPGGN